MSLQAGGSRRQPGMHQGQHFWWTPAPQHRRPPIWSSEVVPYVVPSPKFQPCSPISDERREHGQRSPQRKTHPTARSGQPPTRGDRSLGLKAPKLMPKFSRAPPLFPFSRETRRSRISHVQPFYGDTNGQPGRPRTSSQGVTKLSLSLTHL
jgi:hypothetical protein